MREWIFCFTFVPTKQNSMSKLLEQFNETIEAVEGKFTGFSHRFFMNKIMNEPENAEQCMKVANVLMEAYGFLFDYGLEESNYLRMKSFYLSDNASADEHLQKEYDGLMKFYEEDIQSTEPVILEIAQKTLEQANIIKQYL